MAVESLGEGAMEGGECMVDGGGILNDGVVQFSFSARLERRSWPRT